MNSPIPPSSPDPLKGTQPSIGRPNPPRVSNPESNPAASDSDEFVGVKGVESLSAAPARESLTSTVVGFLQRRTNDNGVLKRALKILNIEDHSGEDKPGGSINTAA